MKKYMFFLLLLFIPFNVYSKASSTIVMDVDSGRIIYEDNINDKRLIASITKIMTCILTIENSDLNKKIIVGDEVIKMYGTNIYLEVGEEITIKDLLYGLMLRSGNDASATLAVNVSGSIDNFVKLMNDKASSLGMTNTIFSNPSGLDDDTKNYSTARDMAILSRYAFNNKIFREIISTKRYKTKTNVRDYIWYNRVSILNNYKYSLGGKNGYTPSAGKTLVSFARKNNLKLLIVTLNDSDIYDNHEKLFNYYFSKYSNYKIIDKKTFKIDTNLISKDVYIKDNFIYPLKDNELDNVSTLIRISNNKNNNIGNIIIKLNDNEIGNIKIYSKNKKEDKLNIFQKFIKLFI